MSAIVFFSNAPIFLKNTFLYVCLSNKYMDKIMLDDSANFRYYTNYELFYRKFY